jgi:hypothetical protein
MWRACRLVIDTGIHQFGWTREEAMSSLRDHAALAEHEITTEIDRYIAWSGQALAYQLGELQIRRQPPFFSSVVPTLNSTRYADNVWFASRLDSRLLKCVRLTLCHPSDDAISLSTSHEQRNLGLLLALIDLLIRKTDRFVAEQLATAFDRDLSVINQRVGPFHRRPHIAYVVGVARRTRRSVNRRARSVRAHVGLTPTSNRERNPPRAAMAANQHREPPL